MSEETKEIPVFTNLDLTYKQSIVDLMFMVQSGHCSCRRAASEIMKAAGKLNTGQNAPITNPDFPTSS